jgi:hypothetical protein
MRAASGPGSAGSRSRTRAGRAAHCWPRSTSTVAWFGPCFPGPAMGGPTMAIQLTSQTVTLKIGNLVVPAAGSASRPRRAATVRVATVRVLFPLTRSGCSTTVRHHRFDARRGWGGDDSFVMTCGARTGSATDRIIRIMAAISKSWAGPPRAARPACRKPRPYSRPRTGRWASSSPRYTLLFLDDLLKTEPLTVLDLLVVFALSTFGYAAISLDSVMHKNGRWLPVSDASVRAPRNPRVPLHGTG